MPVYRRYTSCVPSRGAQRQSFLFLHICVRSDVSNCELHLVQLRANVGDCCALQTVTLLAPDAGSCATCFLTERTEQCVMLPAFPDARAQGDGDSYVMIVPQDQIRRAVTWEWQTGL